MLPEKFLKPYDPAETEPRIYRSWEESGYFNPDNLPGERAEAFSIVLPPPNVTGTLHMGHASMLAIEDILVRFERMRGKKALWLPGTDHAAIATQSKVEKELQKKEKKNRHDLGREEFLRRVKDFAKESHDTIVGQVRRMGSSVDWSREAFTLDETRERAVFEAFKRMFEAGLIYRGDRIVNWDPKGQTTVSDDEIVYQEETTKFYYLKYGPFTIGTARPETKFGDKYVVMHPGDPRYQSYAHGQKLTVEWINGPIEATVIKDEAIDMEFGTGAMTITPWHSVADFDIALRHGLTKEQIIDDRGKLLPIAGEFAGMKISEAREKIIEKLASKGLVERVDEKYVHRVGTAERTGGLIEPQIKLQWFIDVNRPIPERNHKSLKDLMREAVESERVVIMPERFAKVYFHWIENLRDWCISRQIWYGHRIPIWYRGEEAICSMEQPPGEGWVQDEDTLDTWFSSGLWTFSTLGWPEETRDLATFHPTSVLETGYDILFFWVARMILMSSYLLGDVPFRYVYLHGLVRDGQGRKMSKSLGNIIDPVDMIEKYGADATRLSLIMGAAPGNDLKLSEDRVRGYKHFANKLWNIARFVLENSEVSDAAEKYAPEEAELWKEFEVLSSEVTEDIAEFRLYLAGEKLYQYLWKRFADGIIEESKAILKEGGERAASRKALLRNILTRSLKLLHPFIPFVTEEIWGLMPEGETGPLMVASWPTLDA